MKKSHVPVLVVGPGAHDVEAPVELDVDLLAARQRHLDLVVAVLVTDLGAGHLSATGVREGGIAGLLQCGPGDRCVAVGHATRHGDPGAGAHHQHGCGAGDDPLGGSVHGFLRGLRFRAPKVAPAP